jgi:hypothetical protein
MKYIKKFKIFEAKRFPGIMDIDQRQYLETIAVEELKELKEIFADLKDEFSHEVNLIIRPYIWDKTAGLSYEIRIDYSLLKYRTRHMVNPEEIIDRLCNSSDNLAKFWTILNECLRRLRNGNFKYGTSEIGDYVVIQLSFN